MHHEEGEEEQETEGTHFTPTGGQPEGAKGNQRESDHALVGSEETDHRCRLRAGDASIDLELAATRADLLTQFASGALLISWLSASGFSSSAGSGARDPNRRISLARDLIWRWAQDAHFSS